MLSQSDRDWAPTQAWYADRWMSIYWKTKIGISHFTEIWKWILAGKPFFNNPIVGGVVKDNISDQRKFLTQTANGCIGFDATFEQTQ